MSYNRDDRGGSRGGFQPRGRSSFGDRGASRGGGFSRGRSSFGGGRSFDRGNDRGPREMFKATCDNCGKECEVPFRPTNGKPVYCSDCFEKMGGGARSDSRDSRPERPEFRAASQNYDANKSQFDALNAKMDRILGLLEPKVKQEIVTEVIEEVKEEAKAPKVKKASKK
jgi:CxxC-x17-CxxC domain-containing protein